MRKIISDFNGIFINSELAKVIRWYLAVCYFSKKHSEIDKNFIEDICEGRGYEILCKKILNNQNHKENLKYCFQFIGDPRGEFAKKVALKFWKRKISFRELNNIIQLGLEMDNSLMKWFCKPIFGNLDFLQKFKKAIEETYGEKDSIGIITMTTSENFLHLIKSGKKFWKGYEGFVENFSLIDKKGKLKFVECGGDYSTDLSKSKTSKKVEIYKKLLKKLKIKPEKTIVFEDSPSGCLAAKQVGFPFIIGVTNQKYIFHNSSYSILIRNLKELRNYLNLFISCSPGEIINYLEKVLINQ